MADLRPRREPRFLHLSRAEEGQGAAHGRDPARGRRLLAVSRQLSGAGAEAAARQPRPPHPRRQRAGRAIAGDRKSVVWGKSESGRENLGGGRIIKKKKK